MSPAAESDAVAASPTAREAEAFLDLDALEAEARALLEPGFYDYVAGGAEVEATLADNRAAWERIRLRPRMLRDVTQVSTRARWLGAEAASPIGVAPMAMQHAAHADGALATARGAALAGAPMVMGVFGSSSAVEVGRVASAAPRWLQVYVLRDRAATDRVVERALAEGYRALVLTVDVARQGDRRRDRRNRWVFDSRSDGEVADPSEIFDAGLVFEDIARFRARFGVPVIVKGILRGDDALACVEAGAAGVIVSNHGGRQLDGALASADALPEVVAALGSRAEVYVDGGICRGSHALRALALGARGVLVGRPVMWGLATGGAAGVARVLGGLRSELERAMALCGARSLDELDASLALPSPTAG